MSNPKFKVSDRIKIKNQYDEYVHGHIVLIMNPFQDSREYYCSMYPGSMPNYYYICCADLSGSILDDGEINTLQALNKFTEDQLEYSDQQRVRKEKLKQIEKS